MKFLLDHRELFTELSEENIRQIQRWDWSICARKFVGFWQELLNK